MSLRDCANGYLTTQEESKYETPIVLNGEDYQFLEPRRIYRIT